MAEGYARVSDYSEEKIIEAITAFGGDINAAAKALRLSPGNLNAHVYKNKRFRALFVKDVMRADLEPDEVDRMARQAFSPRTDDQDDESRLARAMQASNLDLMADGLQRSGIKEETVDKLKLLGRIEKDAAGFLSASLEMMHRMVVYSGVEMMERAEEIRVKYLSVPTGITEKERQGWQRQYNILHDLMGKSYDRVIHGTEVLARIHNKPSEGEGGKKKKPGFQPIRGVSGAKKKKKEEGEEGEG